MSTQGLPGRQQFDAWASWMAGVFDVEPPTPEHASGFCAENRFWTSAGLTIALATAPALKVSRGWELVRRNPIDHWILSLAGKDVQVSTGAASHLVRGQTLFLSSLSQPFSAARPSDRRLHIYLPRDRFPNLAALDAASGMVLDTPLGRLLAGFLHGFASRLPEFSEEELECSCEALRVMVNACIVPTAGHVAEAAAQLDAARLQRVRSAVRRHLDAPGLDIGLLCRAAEISRTQLYRLFESEGGVMHYIQRQRLLACHGQLADPADGTPIHRIAATRGFGDSSRFSRIFRREFGRSPSDVRAAARSDALSPAPRDAAEPFGRTLNEHLRYL